MNPKSNRFLADNTSFFVCLLVFVDTFSRRIVGIPKWDFDSCPELVVSNTLYQGNLGITGKYSYLGLPTVLQIQVYPKNNAPRVSKPLRVAKSDFLLILKIFLTLVDIRPSN